MSAAIDGTLARGTRHVRRGTGQKEEEEGMQVNGWIERTSRWLGVALAASGLATSAGAAAAARPADGPCQVEKQLNVPARMRDGAVLYADVYRPKPAGSYPVILIDRKSVV